MLKPRSARTLAYSTVAFTAVAVSVGLGAWRFDALPVWLKQRLSPHVAEAQRELDEIRTDVIGGDVVDSVALSSLVGLIDRHGAHLSVDFRSRDTVFIRAALDSLHRLASTREFSRVQELLADELEADTTILTMLGHLLQEHGSYLAPENREAVLETQTALRPRAERFRTIERGLDTLTVIEELVTWGRFVADPWWRPHGLEMAVARSRIDELRDVRRELATIGSRRNVRLCGQVIDRECLDRGSEFPTGIVHVWAQVRVPLRAERLRVVWRGPDPDRRDSATVAVPRGEEVRLSRARSHDTPGQYEVRLYNRERYLIGRAVYSIRDR